MRRQFLTLALNGLADVELTPVEREIVLGHLERTGRMPSFKLQKVQRG